MDSTLERKVKDKIFAAGYSLDKVLAVIPPRDTGDEMIVWFSGRMRSDDRAKLTGDVTDTRYTLWLKDEKDSKPIVTVGLG